MIQEFRQDSQWQQDPTLQRLGADAGSVNASEQHAKVSTRKETTVTEEAHLHINDKGSCVESLV